MHGVENSNTIDQPELAQAGSTPRSTVVQADPDSAERSRFGDSAVAKSSQNATAADSHDGKPLTGMQAGDGDGSASTHNPEAARMRLGSSDRGGAIGSRTADGASRESADGRRADSAGGSAAAGPGDSVPPWKASGWQAQVSRIHSELQAGHIPDAYRDMIGGYFDAH
jgi:hypothetical protein